MKPSIIYYKWFDWKKENKKGRKKENKKIGGKSINSFELCIEQ